MSASSFGSRPPIVFAPHPSRLSSAIERAPRWGTMCSSSPYLLVYHYHGPLTTPDVPGQDSCTSDGPRSWHGPAGPVRGYPIIARQRLLKTPQREKRVVLGHKLKPTKKRYLFTPSGLIKYSLLDRRGVGGDETNMSGLACYISCFPADGSRFCF